MCSDSKELEALQSQRGFPAVPQRGPRVGLATQCVTAARVAYQRFFKTSHSRNKTGQTSTYSDTDYI